MLDRVIGIFLILMMISIILVLGIASLSSLNNIYVQKELNTNIDVISEASIGFEIIPPSGWLFLSHSINNSNGQYTFTCFRFKNFKIQYAFCTPKIVKLEE